MTYYVSSGTLNFTNSTSYDDCLEDKREDYQNCSVLYCVVSQLHSIICTRSCEVFLHVVQAQASFLLVFLCFLNQGQLVCHRVSYFLFCVLFGCCSVVSTSAIGCLERSVPKTTCVSSGTLNCTHSRSIFALQSKAAQHPALFGAIAKMRAVTRIFFGLITAPNAREPLRL